MGLRRSGREAALKILYALEFRENPDDSDTAFNEFWSSHKGSKKLKEYTLGLVSGVKIHSERIDNLINEASRNWKIERLSYMEKNILRIAIFELLECKDVPTAVIINEAIEVSREYAGDEAASFINGILGKIQVEVRIEKKLN